MHFVMRCPAKMWLIGTEFASAELSGVYAESIRLVSEMQSQNHDYKYE